MRFRQAYFTPTNPEKYIGDKQPFARSSWETSYMEYFDRNPAILQWASEPFAIPYIKPTDGKIHYYWPDFAVHYINRDGELVKELIEIKPMAHSRASKARKPHKRLVENVTYAINQAKWAAASQWALENGFTFRVCTEKGEALRSD